jgi:hypothetical protein
LGAALFFDPGLAGVQCVHHQGGAVRVSIRFYHDDDANNNNSKPVLTCAESDFDFKFF